MRYPARQIVRACLLLATLILSLYTFLRYIFAPPAPQFLNTLDFDLSKTEQVDSIRTLVSDHAKELCAKYGWNVFKPPTPVESARKVYDLFRLIPSSIGSKYASMSFRHTLITLLSLKLLRLSRIGQSHCICKRTGIDLNPGIIR